ncbi:MAG: hypothetical protein FWH20_10405 [Oscillospiraceae bacterium]|nr:hypothetical protein [Oscillospiraceae bacterium]
MSNERKILSRMVDELPEEMVVNVISYISTKLPIQPANLSPDEQRLAKLIESLDTPVIDLETDEKGNLVIDREKYPHVYDWAVNG